jgi:hypothetical protein
MRLQKRKIAVVIVTILVGNSYGFSQQVVHDARGFDCGFIYGKTKGAKSGEASCSYTGERVFSDTWRSLHGPREHCDTKEVFSFEDVTLRIDFKANNVVWEREEGLAPFAVSQMIDYYMRKENIGREEAAQKVTQRPPPSWKQMTYDIFHVYKSDEFVSSDPITQALPKEPRRMPVYTVTFGWNVSNRLYSIFIPDNGISGDAILSHYVADGSSSWVNMRFGKCRVLK